MPATGTKAKLRCEASGCEHRTYSSLSNLKRHIDSKHKQAVQMSCGRSFPNHQSNIKRHKNTCGCEILVQSPVPASGTDLGTPMTAATNMMTAPTYDDLDTMLNNFNNGYYSGENNLFGSFQ